MDFKVGDKVRYIGDQVQYEGIVSDCLIGRVGTIKAIHNETIAADWEGHGGHPGVYKQNVKLISDEKESADDLTLERIGTTISGGDLFILRFPDETIIPVEAWTELGEYHLSIDGKEIL